MQYFATAADTASLNVLMHKSSACRFYLEALEYFVAKDADLRGRIPFICTVSSFCHVFRLEFGKN
jgi:hypothetical protein